jgi:hypothetical protein
MSPWCASVSSLIARAIIKKKATRNFSLAGSSKQNKPILLRLFTREKQINETRKNKNISKGYQAKMHLFFFASPFVVHKLFWNIQGNSFDFIPLPPPLLLLAHYPPYRIGIEIKKKKKELMKLPREKERLPSSLLLLESGGIYHH